MRTIRKTREERLISVVVYTATAAFVLFTLYPFYYCIMLSFNDGRDAMRGGIYLWPRQFSLESYRLVFANPVILVALRNTVLRTVIGTLLALLVTSLFSYAITRPGLRFKRFYITLAMVTMYFGGGLIPTYLVMRDLKLVNNFLVYIVPNLFAAYNSIIMMSFFRELPTSLEESAKIDGAKDFLIFFRIIVPISGPVLATIALFVGVAQWNAWYDTMLYTRSEELETLSHLMMKMINSAKYAEELVSKVSVSTNAMSNLRGMTSNSLQLATMVVTAFPIIVIYPFLQKYFVKGVMIGSIKG